MNSKMQTVKYFIIKSPSSTFKIFESCWHVYSMALFITVVLIIDLKQFEPGQQCMLIIGEVQL